MIDRYRAIEATEDLGLGYPPFDCSDDLVGAHENAPGSAGTDSEGDVQIHH